MTLEELVEFCKLHGIKQITHEGTFIEFWQKTEPEVEVVEVPSIETVPAESDDNILFWSTK